jgi:dienelactone hydrolase
VHPENFEEKQVTFGLDDWKLPGILTAPRAEGRHPGVVLVHGSGPNDHDETVGGTQVFRDLAEGLSSRGIAVLRYDKRTRAHASRTAAMKNLTVKEEVVDDAAAAVDFLAGQPGIDPKRIFLIGHSLGGYLAPRIARVQKKLAGLVVVAGNTRPIEELVVEQVEYLLPMQIPDPVKAKAEIERVRGQVAELQKLAPDAESSLVIFGMPARYLLDLRAYDPAAEAKALGLPMLVLQGERDYQVTMQDFGGWKKALDGSPRATLKSYPTLNHLFVAGEGKSKPTEYPQPGNVAAEVVADIAGWIAAVGR